MIRKELNLLHVFFFFYYSITVKSAISLNYSKIFIPLLLLYTVCGLRDVHVEEVYWDFQVLAYLEAISV